MVAEIFRGLFLSGLKSRHVICYRNIAAITNAIQYDMKANMAGILKGKGEWQKKRPLHSSVDTFGITENSETDFASLSDPKNTSS